MMRTIVITGFLLATGLLATAPAASAECLYTNPSGVVGVKPDECDEYANRTVVYATQCVPRYVPWYIICLGHTIEGTPCPPSPAC